MKSKYFHVVDLLQHSFVAQGYSGYHGNQVVQQYILSQGTYVPNMDLRYSHNAQFACCYGNSATMATRLPIMYQPDHPPWQNPRSIFLIGKFPKTQAKKEFKTPTPGAFFSIIHCKNMKK